MYMVTCHEPGRDDDPPDQELASGRQTFQLAIQGVGQGGSRGMLAGRMLFGEWICFRLLLMLSLWKWTVELVQSRVRSCSAACVGYSFIAPGKACRTSHSPTKAPDLPKMASAFLDPISISSREYAFTDSGNVISRSAKIYGASNIVINGRSVIEKGCVIRGDLQRVVATPGVGGNAGTMSMQLASNTTSVNAGRYLSVGQGTVLRPPGKLYKG